MSADADTSQLRWAPDEQLVPAVLAGSAHLMAALSAPDRAWLVAGLTVAGWPAERIAASCGCSLRLVRTIRADPLTLVCERLAAESEHFADELRLVRSEMSRLAADHVTLLADRDRMTRMIARYTGAADGRPLCSKGRHPMTSYNTYERTDPVTGRTRSWCRECGRARQAAYRSRLRVQKHEDRESYDGRVQCQDDPDKPDGGPAQWLVTLA